MAMGLHYLAISMSVLHIISCSAMADKAKDREECTNQLVELATCLAYVGGNAKAPTPDCCSGLKQVLKDNKKCLCEIIRDRNDPELGLNINVTIALGLPSVCHAPANVSQCPALLRMDPNSPEAQVFYQFARGSTHGTNATVPAPTPTPFPTGGGNSVSATTSSKGTSDGCCNIKRWLGLGLEIVSGGVLLLYFIGSYHII